MDPEHAITPTQHSKKPKDANKDRKPEEKEEKKRHEDLKMQIKCTFS